jgi:ADP-heptose:LPS heptosyltransferase
MPDMPVGMATPPPLPIGATGQSAVRRHMGSRWIEKGQGQMGIFSPAQPFQRILLIQGRNLGDAVIGTGLVEALGRSFPDDEISVFTRPQFRPLYASNPYVSSIHLASFPMGTDKRFGFRPAVRLIMQLEALRRRHFKLVIHIGGDFRENLLGWIISPRGTVSLAWGADHPFRHKIRAGLAFLQTYSVPIMSGEPSVYGAQEQLASALGSRTEAHPRVYAENGRPILHSPDGNKVGIHVSASQEFKRWPVASWRAVISGLRARNMGVHIFAAPEERPALLSDYGDLLGNDVEIVTGSLLDFFVALSHVRAVVCLDSFSVHAAHAIGVPSIVLSGANTAELYAPPSTEVIASGQRLPCAQCMNRPSCVQSNHSFVCIRDIAPDQVLSRLDQLVMTNRTILVEARA